MINEREVQMLRWVLFLFVLCNAGRLAAEDVSPLADKPRWPTLERYQETMTRDDFTRLLQNVYATRGYDDLVQIGDDSARSWRTQLRNDFSHCVSPRKPRGNCRAIIGGALINLDGLRGNVRYVV